MSSSKIEEVLDIVTQFHTISNDIMTKLNKQKNMSLTDLIELESNNEDINIFKFIKKYENNKNEFIKNIAQIIIKTITNEEEDNTQVQPESVDTTQSYAKKLHVPKRRARASDFMQPVEELEEELEEEPAEEPEEKTEKKTVAILNKHIDEESLREKNKRRYPSPTHENTKRIKMPEQYNDLMIPQEYLDRDILVHYVAPDKKLFLYKVRKFFENIQYFHDKIYWRESTDNKRMRNHFAPVINSFYTEVNFTEISNILKHDFNYFIDGMLKYELSNSNKYIVNKMYYSIDKNVDVDYYYHGISNTLLITTFSKEKIELAYEYFTNIKHNVITTARGS